MPNSGKTRDKDVYGLLEVFNRNLKCSTYKSKLLASSSSSSSSKNGGNEAAEFQTLMETDVENDLNVTPGAHENSNNNNNGVIDSSLDRTNSTEASPKEGESLENSRHEGHVVLGKGHFNFGRCRVCKDKATGVHYGISSCEGCKGFFKRSISKHEKYVCFFGNKCIITPKQRKRCKLCRWRSCLEAGMSFESIKMGRIPKLEKEKAAARSQNDPSSTIDEFEELAEEEQPLNGSNGVGEGGGVVAKPAKFSIERLCASDKENLINYLTVRNILNLSKEHLFKKHDTAQLVPQSHFTDIYLNTFNENILFIMTLLRDKCYQLFIELRRQMDTSYEYALRETSKPKHLRQKPLGWELPPDEAWPLMLSMIGEHVKSLAYYARQLPGFNRISNEDLALIINNNTFAVFGLKTARLFIDGENYVIACDRLQVTRAMMTQVLGKLFADKLFAHHDRINNLNLSDYELAVLAPLMMTTPNLNLNDSQPLIELNEYYKRVVLYEFSLSKRDEKFVRQVIEVLSYIPENEKMCHETNYTGKKPDDQ